MKISLKMLNKSYRSSFADQWKTKTFLNSSKMNAWENPFKIAWPEDLWALWSARETKRSVTTVWMTMKSIYWYLCYEKDKSSCDWGRIKKVRRLWACKWDQTLRLERKILFEWQCLESCRSCKKSRALSADQDTSLILDCGIWHWQTFWRAADLWKHGHQQQRLVWKWVR